MRPCRGASHVTLVVPALGLGLGLGLALGLGGCSGSGDEPQAASSSAGATPGLPTPSGEGTQDVSPSGEVTEDVSPSEPAQELGLGEEATVTYSPDADRTSLLTATVDNVRGGSVEDFTTFSLSEAERRSRIYYVDATLSNAGGQELGDAAVPLYAVDGTGTAVQPTSLVGSFPPCPGGGVLPTEFAPAQRTRTCLLYLLPRDEKLAAVRLPDAEGAGFSWTVPDRDDDGRGDKGDDGRGDKGDDGRGDKGDDGRGDNGQDRGGERDDKDSDR